MGTPRTEIRQPRRQFWRVVRAFCICDLLQGTVYFFIATAFFDENFTNRRRDLHRIERHIGFEQRNTILFGAINSPPVTIIENSIFCLGFDQLAFFFDNNDQVQSFGPIVKTVRIKRPGLHNFIGRNSKALGLLCINAKCR